MASTSKRPAPFFPIGGTSLPNSSRIGPTSSILPEAVKLDGLLRESRTDQAGELRQRPGPPGQGVKDVLDVHDTDDVVEAAVAERKTCMPGLVCLAQLVFNRIIFVEVRDQTAGHHVSSRHPVFEVQDILHEQPFPPGHVAGRDRIDGVEADSAVAPHGARVRSHAAYERVRQAANTASTLRVRQR